MTIASEANVTGVQLCGAAFITALLRVQGAEAQRDTTRVVTPTLALGVIGQQTTQFGAVWPGLAASAGFDIPLAGSAALRLEGMLAGFTAGADASTVCPQGVACTPLSTPSVLGGGSASFVLRRGGIPVYAAVGIGAWRTGASGDGTKTGPTFAFGLAPLGHRISLEARYDRPSSPLGALESTFAVSLRFAR